ncbi:MAG: glycosyltransferase family 4 protein [Puniceicoccales bacterium]|nr:glycosyltransferase family 4 protein [Puniceicoccales bacterium]
MFDGGHVSVGVGLRFSDGGLTTNVNHFTLALGGSVVVFSSDDACKCSLITNNIHQVKIYDNFFGRAFAYANSRVLGVAEEYIADMAGIVTCHCLYRFHCHFVHGIFKKYGIPYNVVLHGALDEIVRAQRKFRKSLWLNIFGKRFLADAKHVICATLGEKNNASKFFPGANYVNLYWPTEFYKEKWAELAEKKAEIKARYGIKEGYGVLLYLGRLNSVKNPLDVIESLKGFHSKVVLLLIGPEDDISFNQCYDVAKKCDVEIKCTGFADLEMKEEIFAITDYYISLSRHENFNYALVEALARGIPGIISRGNDLRHDIVDGAFCTVVDSPEDVGFALQELEGVSGYESMVRSKSASEWVGKNMQFSDFRDKLLILYQ